MPAALWAGAAGESRTKRMHKLIVMGVAPVGERGVLRVPASQPLPAQLDAVARWLREAELS